MVDWTALLLLGAYHGANPGMGWLFAVALGMQQGSVRGVFRALLPIGLGHASAVAMVLVIAAAVHGVVGPALVRSAAAAALIALGLYMLWRHPHPRYGGGMVVGFGELAGWSFLMASAHGAGLMVLPFVLDVPGSVSAAPMDHSTHDLLSGHTTAAAVLALGAHTLSYFTVMTTAAWVVYRKVGLAVLRAAWFDMDRVWAAALLITGSVILFS